MVTQEGSVGLRSGLLAIALLIGVTTSVSFGGLTASAVSQESVEPELEQSVPLKPGFTLKAVYCEQATRYVRYITKDTVNALEFVLRDESGSETIEVHDKNPSPVEGHKTWQPAHNPSVCDKKLFAQIPKNENSNAEASVLDGDISLQHYPTVTLSPFGSPRSGGVLEVHGEIKGVLGGITEDIHVQLLSLSDLSEIRSDKIGAQDKAGRLASFSLEGVEAGDYSVKLTILGFDDWKHEIGSAQVTVAQVALPDSDEPTRPVEAPIVPTPALSLLPTLEKDKPVRLSTNFATPLPTSRTVTPSYLARTSAATDDADVLGEQTREMLEQAIDLSSTTTGASGLPVEATPQGWTVFGVAWYWWLTGGATTIGGTVYVIRRGLSQP